MEKRAGNGKQEKVYRIFEEIAGSYDSANERISLGMQRLWKKMLADRLFKDVGSMSEKAPRILDPGRAHETRLESRRTGLFTGHA